jgi:hypothetical protein
MIFLQWICDVWYNISFSASCMLPVQRMLQAWCDWRKLSRDPKKQGAAGIGETAELDWWSVPREVTMHWNETRVYCEPHSALNINRACCTLRRDINSDSSVNGCCHIDVTVKWKERTVRLKAEWKHRLHSHNFQISFSMAQILPWMAHRYSVGQESTCFYRTWEFITAYIKSD